MSNIFVAIKFIMKLIDIFEKIGVLVKEKKLNDWISDLEKTVDNGEKAETPAEKRAVASDLVRLIGGLGG